MAIIAVIGANGQLGYDLMRAASPGDTLVGLDHAEIEVSDPESVDKALRRAKPDVVINTAAFHRTELCEVRPDEAFRVNAAGSFNVAKTARDLEAKVIYISTDYVFDGSKQSFTEGDNPNPLNIYGASKFAGEIATRIGNPKHYIIRTSSLFGKNVSRKGYNFVTLMLKRAKEEPEIRVVNDQTSAPTYTLDLAAKIHELIAADPSAGIYHITNQGSASWYDFAAEIFRLVGVSPKLVPITTAESGTKIKRPQFSVLENAGLRETGVALLRPWQDALRAYIDEVKI